MQKRGGQQHTRAGRCHAHDPPGGRDRSNPPGVRQGWPDIVAEPEGDSPRTRTFDPSGPHENSSVSQAFAMLPDLRKMIEQTGPRKIQIYRRNKWQPCMVELTIYCPV